MDFSDTWEIEYNGERMVYYVRVKQTHLITLPCKLEGQEEYQVRDVYAWSSPIWVLPD